MPQLDEIMGCIDNRLRKFISDVRLRPSDEAILLYVPREKVSGKVRPGFTSERQMRNLQKKIAKTFSRKVEVIYIFGETHQKLEEAFYQILNHRYSGNLMSFYMSLDENNTVNAWIEVSDLTDELKGDIEQHYLNMLKEAELASGSVQWIAPSHDLPTSPWLLRFLKTHQPINLEDMERRVVDSFSSVNKKWLNKRLDQLRKKGLIIRQISGSYVLTSKALSIVPAGARYSSSDVDRALALGRRKW